MSPIILVYITTCLSTTVTFALLPVRYFPKILILIGQYLKIRPKTVIRRQRQFEGHSPLTVFVVLTRKINELFACNTHKKNQITNIVDLSAQARSPIIINDNEPIYHGHEKIEPAIHRRRRTTIRDIAKGDGDSYDTNRHIQHKS